MRRGLALSVGCVMGLAGCGGARATDAPVLPVGAYALATYNGYRVPTCDTGYCVRRGMLAITAAQGRQRYVLRDSTQNGFAFVDSGGWQVPGGDTVFLLQDPPAGTTAHGVVNVAILRNGVLTTDYAADVYSTPAHRVYQSR